MNNIAITAPLSALQKLNTRILFFALASMLVGLFILYAYQINRTIMNVVAREDAAHEIANLSSTIGDLEFKYMTAKSMITMNLAYQKGFHDSVPSQFISRSGSTLSYNTR
jgi:hypothetical protein